MKSNLHTTFSTTKLMLCGGLAFLLAACGASQLNVRDQGDGSPLVGATGVYTLTNLHPDPVNMRLYTVNYQQAGLIPVCTEVMVTRATSKAVIFQVDGREYEYIRHKTLTEPFDQHIQQVFGKTCPQNQIAGMSRLDREGIEEGKAKVGMSKAAVAIAMGPPPSHATRSMDLDQWMYWQNRFGRLSVEFENGKVSEIVD